VSTELSSTDKDLLFSVVFAAGFSGDISAALFDTAFDPDRQLATKTWAVTVYGNFDLTGTIRTQGKTNWGGVEMVLTGAVYTYNASSLDKTGFNISFADVADGTYTISVIQARYLDVTAALNKTFVVQGGATVIPLLYLYGGDADDNNVINISDASIIGSTYGNTGDLPGDVNFDGKVNLQDLALVGGNYGLTSATAYSTWLSP
jgi:hypothetical protein